ncbi:YbaL family putative K(+) efflux transporter [Montanilutibacter psychrotolerans]|uniref:Kef family K(+) transporter n=1 Tax=Montanilutibacter psychrotolerans TaxID=1327343 RepID=A0A3M8STA4_9GAMM|nr:YbaL family putative K(+) efflux transporter [Lysobacter psychrotolerans]RNF84547.1 Kef family K(+) transporter [Lysobacter psychrotolerans]
MQHHTPLIALLASSLVLAFIFGSIANRLKLSPLAGYLIAGIVIGPFTPGFVADENLAFEISEIGVILLMFGVGLHFSLRDLMSVKTIAVPGAVVQIAVATALGWGLALALGWSHGAGLVFGLALSVASTVVLLRALEDRRLLESERGRIAVGWLIVEDLAMVIALVLLPALAGALGGKSASAGDLSLGASLLLTLGKLTAFVVVMLVVGRRVIPWVLERVAGTGSRELFTLCVLAIAMGVAFGSTYLFGVSVALGAFFAGMMLNESEFSHKAAADSLPMRDAFAVLFFVSIGMLFDPSVVLDNPLAVLATFLVIVIGKSLAAFAIVRAFGRSNSIALTISASLAQIGEFSFILAGIGVDIDVLPAEGRDLVLAGALLSIIANPLIFAALDKWQARADAHAVSKGMPVDDPPPQPIDIAGHAIVVGFGRVGSHLAKLLHERGVPVVVIEDDGDRADQARAAGLPVVRGNAVHERVLLEASPGEATMAVFAIPQPLEAGEAMERLKKLNPALTILARAHSETEVRHLLAHGADAAVLAERELAHSIAEMVMATPHYRGNRHLPPAIA